MQVALAPAAGQRSPSPLLSSSARPRRLGNLVPSGDDTRRNIYARVMRVFLPHSCLHHGRNVLLLFSEYKTAATPNQSLSDGRAVPRDRIPRPSRATAHHRRNAPTVTAAPSCTRGSFFGAVQPLR